MSMKVKNLMLLFAFSFVANLVQAEEKTYSLTEVAKHAVEEDCWMAIEGRVYDVTEYTAKHPAGPGPMIIWCGIDATDGMRTKGIGDDHSPDAWQELKKYLIGKLE